MYNWEYAFSASLCLLLLCDLALALHSQLKEQLSQVKEAICMCVEIAHSFIVAFKIVVVTEVLKKHFINPENEPS